MKLKYVEESFGVDSLTDGRVYECLGLEYPGLLRIVDDSGEDYLYSPINPRPMDGSAPGGRWEIVEDDAENTLSRVINESVRTN